MKIHKIQSQRKQRLTPLAILIACCWAILPPWNHGQLWAQAPGEWQPISSPVTASLRGVSAVSDQVVWIGGGQGTILRSTNGGKQFQALKIPNSEEMDFRDLKASDAETCSVMVAGQPARFYHTSNGGQTWSVAYEHPSKAAFFDAMAFWDERRGIAFSDALEGRLVIVSTVDGGRTWTQHSSELSPRVSAEEHGYAASGTCLTVGSEGQVWIGLGGPSENGNSRVFHSTDFGQNWQSGTTTLKGSESAGVFSLIFLNSDQGIAVGGDYRETAATQSILSLSEDGGRTWATPQNHQLRGFRSSIVAPSRGKERVLLTCGPDGCDFSVDGGKSWKALKGQGYHAMDFTQGSGWAVGADGRIARWIWKDAVE